MGNSSAKQNGNTSSRRRSTRNRFSFKVRNKKGEKTNGEKSPKFVDASKEAKPRLEKRALSLRPNKNGIESTLPLYYDVNWGKSGQLGKGHYAVVFKGLNKATKAPVAVKRIQRKLARDQTLKTEVDALYKVSGHKNIVQMHDVFYDNKYVVVIMELLAGGELFERIVNSGAYSERDASKHIRKIASALAFMHEKGIVHRDLKPENLVLVSKDPNSEIKISDFGLSKIMKEDQATMQTVCGTRAYSAPEVGFGGPPRSGKYTAKVDSWSLGVILYVILAAYHPFDPYGESNDQQIWSRICKGEWDFNDEVWHTISNEAKDLIKHLICVDVSRRYSAKQILEHPWIVRFNDMPNQPIRMASSLGSLRSMGDMHPNSPMPLPSTRNVLAANGNAQGTAAGKQEKENAQADATAKDVQVSTPNKKDIETV